LVAGKLSHGIAQPLKLFYALLYIHWIDGQFEFAEMQLEANLLFSETDSILQCS